MRKIQRTATRSQMHALVRRRSQMATHPLISLALAALALLPRAIWPAM